MERFLHPGAPQASVSVSMRKVNSWEKSSTLLSCIRFSMVSMSPFSVLRVWDWRWEWGGHIWNMRFSLGRKLMFWGLLCSRNCAWGQHDWVHPAIQGHPDFCTFMFQASCNGRGTHSNLKALFFFKLDNWNEDLQDPLELTPKKKKKKTSFSSLGTRMQKKEVKRHLE